MIKFGLPGVCTFVTQSAEKGFTCNLVNFKVFKSIVKPQFAFIFT